MAKSWADQDFELVQDALAWHEYGSQDERRAKAVPALDRIKDRLEQVRFERDEYKRGMENNFNTIADLLTRIEEVNEQLHELRDDEDGR